MLTGKIMGHGVATTPRGDRVPYVLIEPARTRDNITEMAREMKRWSRIANVLRGYKPASMASDPIAKRASFGEDVIAITAEDVRLGQCCILMAQAQDGRILGVVEYIADPDQAGIELLAIDPTNLAGVSGDHGLRGVGTGIVAAISRRMLISGSPRVTLIPFDGAARHFWMDRGFKECYANVLCIDGREGIARLIGTCEDAPDCPDQGECVACGIEARAMMMRPPETRAATQPTNPEEELDNGLLAWYDFADDLYRELRTSSSRDWHASIKLLAGGLMRMRRLIISTDPQFANALWGANTRLLQVDSTSGSQSVAAPYIRIWADKVLDAYSAHRARLPQARAWTAAQDAQMRLSKAVAARDRYQLAYNRLPMAERMRQMGRYQGGLQPLQREVDVAREGVRRA